MGVKLLNRFIKNKCFNNHSIKRIGLYKLSNKIVAIDTSIFMYRFAQDNSIYEGFYNMCSLLRRYNIIPLFVFDGKPPKEKESELRERSEEKKKAEKSYNELKEQLKSTYNENDIEEIEQHMDKLRKKFIRIKVTDIINVKKIITAFGLMYVDAPGESDELCGYLALNKKVYAVMSEDMDMFVYGCPIIIRYFSMSNHNCVIYKTDEIIKSINMEPMHFKQLCILSGTDYKKNIHNNIFSYHKKYFMFQRSGKNCMFEYFNPNNINHLNHILDMFDVKDRENLCEFKDNIKIENGEVNIDEIKEIMKKDNFIFL